MKRFCIYLAAATAMSVSAYAQQAPAAPSGQANALQSTLVQSQQDLNSTLDKLATLQAQIQEERIPLARELRELETQVTEKRRELERVQRLRDNSSLSLTQLQQQVKARQESIDYMSNLVGEYGRAFEVRLRGGERQTLSTKLNAFDAARTNADMARDAKLMSTIPVVDLGLDRALEVSGGSINPGQGVLPSGEIVDGQFLLFGPLTYFTSGTVAGLSDAAVQGPPHITPLAASLQAPLTSTIQSGEGILPLDATLGDAAAIAATEETVVQHIKKGGIWMIPIIASGIAALIVALIKFFQIYRMPKPDFSAVHDVLVSLRNGDVEGARSRAQATRGVAGEMLVDGVDHAGASDELVEEIMMERILDVQPKLESMLPFIAVSAATAPLLGLLGTVTGMINTFTLITVFGTGDAKSLSGGISEALITTEYGLIVAIPALVLHALLSRRVQTVLADLEHVAVSFVNGLSRPIIERE